MLVRLLEILLAGVLFSLIIIVKNKKFKKVLFFVLLGCLLLLGVGL